MAISSTRIASIVRNSNPSNLTFKGSYLKINLGNAAKSLTKSAKTAKLDKMA